jgi:N-methylhydantoinase B/oxoprolinase/acetone carboxylase alpha subunit
MIYEAFQRYAALILPHTSFSHFYLATILIYVSIHDTRIRLHAGWYMHALVHARTEVIFSPLLPAQMGAIISCQRVHEWRFTSNRVMINDELWGRHC